MTTSNALAVANPLSAAGPFVSAEDARQLIERMLKVMDALLTTLGQEVLLVRAGRLRDAAAFSVQKSELAGMYVAGATRIKGNAGFVSKHLPDLAGAFSRQHETFQIALSHSMAVLATVHAVAEGLIRGAAEEAARRTAPQTYGPGGRAVAPATYSATPIAVSRVS